MSNTEKLTSALLDETRSTYFPVETTDQWVKTTKEEILKLLGNIDFGAIIVSRDVIECYVQDIHILSICRREEDFFVKDEREEGTPSSLQEVSSSIQTSKG